MTFALLLPLLCPIQDLPAQDILLRMADGRLLVAELLDHDFDGLHVRELRSGGLLTLSWEDLHAGESDRLRSALGYRVETSVPQVPAHRILLVNGQTLVGRVIRQDDEFLEIRVHESTSLIPLLRLAAPPEEVLVPAMEVLTPDQYWRERRADVDLEDPIARFKFAVELQTVFALDQAIEELDAALALEPEPSLLTRIENMRVGLERTMRFRNQAEALEKVRTLLHRNRFVLADEALGKFEVDFPDSPLRADWLDLVDRFQEEREAALVEELARRWYSTATSIIKKQAMNRGADPSQLQTWAETLLPDLIRRNLLTHLQKIQPEIALDDVDSYWSQRSGHLARNHKASYGNGSWILGEDRARAGLDPEESAEDGRSAEAKALEDRVKRYLENIERSRRAAAGEEEISPQDWWRKSSVNQRFQWLFAWYAEFSGDWEVVRPSFVNCVTCAGKGVLEFLEIGAQGSKSRNKVCSTCQGVGVRRTVVFR